MVKFTKYQIFLAFLLVISGSFNTLTIKLTDKLESAGRDGKVRVFNHPFLQANFMFLGEILCLIAFNCAYCYFRKRGDGSEDTHALTCGNRHYNPFILLIPAILDMSATCMMYVGLTLTYASSFQMLRGSVIIFVALLSYLFLGQRPGVKQLLGIFFIIVGLALVGIADLITSNEKIDAHKIVLGDLIIILAQIITASQMVFEEKFVGGLDIPALVAVGWEGFFGFIVLSLILIPFYFIELPRNLANPPRYVIEDSWDAIIQIFSNVFLTLSTFGAVFSIAFFNFAGISISKEISATTRMVLDSVRTMVIWLVSLAVKWQTFHYLQLVGFTFLMLGMFLYNNIIKTPKFMENFCRKGNSDDAI